MALIQIDFIVSSSNPDSRAGFKVEMSRVPCIGEYVTSVRPSGIPKRGGYRSDEVFRVETVFHHIGHRAGEPEATVRVLVA